MSRSETAAPASLSLSVLLPSAFMYVSLFVAALLFCVGRYRR
jgi:ABC-type multidrug transport system permease subunit